VRYESVDGTPEVGWRSNEGREEKMANDKQREKRRQMTAIFTTCLFSILRLMRSEDERLQDDDQFSVLVKSGECNQLK
jgi:hypothetical protein